jgi:hypothetical protein
VLKSAQINVLRATGFNFPYANSGVVNGLSSVYQIVSQQAL